MLNRLTSLRFSLHVRCSSPYHFGGLGLALLQSVNVFPKLVSPKQDTVLHTQ